MPKHNPTAQRVVPIVGWPGGKSRLLRHLLPLIERCPHKTYVEPFAGGAAVLLAKRPAHLEVLNDLNGELINVYRCARHHTRELLRLVRALPSGRAVFREVKESRPETDLLRAARFFYLLKCSTFGQAHSWLNKPLPRRGLGKRLAAFRRRMECVILECRPAEELLPIYDTPQTLFFLDPPYVGTGHLDSYNNYTPERLEALAKQVRCLKGRFILTIDDRPEHRVLFEGYTQLPVTTAANMRPGHTFSELIVHNVCDVAAAQAAHDEPRHRHLPEVTP